MTDVFTSASPTYRRAMSKAASPLPLAYGEVAELPRARRIRFYILTAAQLVAVSLPLILIWAVLG